MEYTIHDQQLASNGVMLALQSAGQIEFQFPPRIPSDNRRGTWKEGELRGTEPVAAFSTSGPRIITMSWYYILDGGQWPASRIQKNITNLRGYFAQVKDPGSTRDNLTVDLLLWGIGGRDPISARIVSIDVKHGDTIIGPPAEAYFLRTDVSVDLRLWTRGTSVADAAAGGTVAITNLAPVLTPDWY